MPKDFLFPGIHWETWALGKHMKVETLKIATIEYIKDVVLNSRDESTAMIKLSNTIVFEIAGSFKL
jgi:hypothetical protein